MSCCHHYALWHLKMVSLALLTPVPRCFPCHCWCCQTWKWTWRSFQVFPKETLSNPLNPLLRFQNLRRHIKLASYAMLQHGFPLKHMSQRLWQKYTAKRMANVYYKGVPKIAAEMNRWISECTLSPCIKNALQMGIDLYCNVEMYGVCHE